MPQLLLEHQGKEILRSFGVATPSGVVVRRGDVVALEQLPCNSPAVVKTQIAAGGRGKAGGIRFTSSDEELREAVSDLLGATIMGQPSEAVLIEERIAIRNERYAAIGIIEGELVLMIGAHGGVDVEEITASDSDNMVTVAVDPLSGIDDETVTRCLGRLGFDAAHRPAYLDLAKKLLSLCRHHDATLVEINPLAETCDGDLVALDARIAVDTAALPRQPKIAAMLDSIAAGSTGRPTSNIVAIRPNPNGGSIGLIGLGGGLNLTIVDWVAKSGSGVHSLADVDSAIAAGSAQEAFSTIFGAYDAEPGIDAVLVNIITAGYRLDDIVAALVPSLRGRIAEGAKPVVLHLYGNAMSETPKLLADAGFSNSTSLRDAIARVVAASGS